MSLHRTLSGVLVLAVACSAFLAAMPWLRAYQVADAPFLLALAATLPVLIAAGASRVLRFDALVSYAISATGLIALLAISNDFDFGSIRDGLGHVPAQLLTETLPLSGSTYLLAAPVVLTWLSATASAELLLRPTRPAAIGSAIPVVYFALAFVATTSAPPSNTVAEGAGLFGALVVGALVRQGLIEVYASRAEARVAPLPGTEAAQPHRPRSLRKALTGAGMAGALASALALSVSSVPALATKPTTLARPTQLLSGTVVDPLDALASLRDSDPTARATTLFTLKVDQSWSGYISLAALDDYDGNSWSFSATFRPTGGRVPLPGSQSANEPRSRQVVQRFTLESSIGLPFLPALDRPLEVDGLAVDADATTGMVAASPALPARYRVMSRVPQATMAGLAPRSPLAVGAKVPGGDTQAYTALPAGSATDVAAAVRFSANLTGLLASPSFAFLQRVVRSLRTDERRVSLKPSSSHSVPAALAGTSLAQVMNAVTITHAATPEQFATFFAVVARYLGVPARVVTGFRSPGAPKSPKPLPAGTYEMTNRDAWTWDEIPVAGYGWVVVDPTPVLTTADVSAPAEQVRPSAPVHSKQATALPGRGAAHAIAKPVKVRVTPALHINWPLTLGAGLPAAVIVVLLATGLGVPALRRRLRRLARHQPGDPVLLAAGAWLELIDNLSRLGLDVAVSATSDDVVALVTSRFGDDFGPPTRVVGALADQALYCAHWPVDSAQAQLAWDSQHRICRAVRRGRGWRERSRALLLVGPGPARPSTGGTR